MGKSYQIIANIYFVNDKEINKAKFGPIFTFFFVFVGLILGSEILLHEQSFTASVFFLAGALAVMTLWKVGYWYEDGESITSHFMLMAICREFFGFFLSPKKIIWFWTIDRPYFRACTIATWLAVALFWWRHYGEVSV